MWCGFVKYNVFGKGIYTRSLYEDGTVIIKGPVPDIIEAVPDTYWHKNPRPSNRPR